MQRLRQRQRSALYIPVLLLSAIFCRAAEVAEKTGDAAAAGPAQSSPAAAPSLALSPGVVEVKARPGVSTTHALTMSNLTGTRLRFVMEAFDVVVRDGKRVFIPAGETAGGIARSAVFDPAAIELDSGARGEVKVTLTVPDDPKVRAVVAIFRGQTALHAQGAVMFTGSLGALVTYNLSPDVRVKAGAPTVTPQTGNRNLVVAEQLENDGQEPAIPKGTLAILRSSGELVGRVTIQPHRLLPGEKFDCSVEYPHTLHSGKYRAMMSIQHEGGVQSSGLEFQVE